MNNLEKFGKIISQELWDRSLNRYLDLEAGNLKSPELKELISKLSEFTEEQKIVIRKLLTECVNSGIHGFLFAIEEEKEGISIAVNGQIAANQSDGLSGELYSEDGWLERYSEHGQNGI
ncbi:hypothetical protein [Microbulbifer sp. PAAF003]|uniref:hypothetical protein n=1 Tax=Microbulbifer sp. PAAF003 TaxID=3243375 RepID=UPI004039900F